MLGALLILGFVCIAAVIVGYSLARLSARGELKRLKRQSDRMEELARKYFEKYLESHRAAVEAKAAGKSRDVRIGELGGTRAGERVGLGVSDDDILDADVIEEEINGTWNN